jgi:hypothetical protein
MAANDRRKLAVSLLTTRILHMSVLALINDLTSSRYCKFVYPVQTSESGSVAAKDAFIVSSDHHISDFVAVGTNQL